MNSERRKTDESKKHSPDKILNFDDFLNILGELGPYQIPRLFFICLVGIICAFHAMNMVFVGAKPEYRCSAPDFNVTSLIFGNTTEQEIKDFLQSTGKCYSYDVAETKRLLISGNYTLAELRSNNVSIQVDKCNNWEFSRNVYGPTIVTQFNLVCDKDWLRTTSKTLYFFGRLLGAVFFGQLSDILGRKPTLFTCLVLLLVAGSVSTIAPNIYVFIPLYIMQGAAQTGLFLVAYTMGTELVGPKYRLFVAFLVQSAYSIGYITLAGLAFAIRDWQFIELAITLPVVVFFPFIWLLPESIRWLLSKRKDDQVKQIIQKVSDTNHVNITDAMIENLIKTEQKSKPEIIGKKCTICDLCRPPMLYLSVNVWLNWLVNAMVYYGLSLGTDNLGGDPYVNFCIAGAVEIPSFILCILFLNKLGRKKPLFASMVVGGLSCIASGFIDLVPLKIAFAMIGKFCITASYAIIYLLAVEVFPTVVRNIGMGVSSMCARMGGMLAPQILELNQFWNPLPLILFGSLAVLSGCLSFLLPETSGKPLPQTIEDVTIGDNIKARKNEIILTVSADVDKKKEETVNRSV